MTSLWRKEIEGIEGVTHSNSGENTNYDVIVIGAGLCGILTAYYLKKAGKKVLIIETNKIACGQTERTTAKITSQHGLKYQELIKNVGAYKARLYARSNEEAIEEYERLVKENNIACDFIKIPAFLYSTKEEKLKKELDAATSVGINAEYKENLDLPFSVKGAVMFPNQAQFSPLKFIKHLVMQLEILEDTKVIKVKKNKVYTESEKTKDIFYASKIVMATHYPIKNVPGFYFLRQHQERSYVVAISGSHEIDKIKGMYYSVDASGLSLRRKGDILLLGGSSNRTGNNKKGGAYDFLINEANKYFRGYKEECRWSAQDCIPHDKIPFIGKYSVFTPHLYVATGFQKWGMTTSMIAARLLSDEICGVDNPYKELYSPQRLNIKAGIKDLLRDVGISVCSLSKGMFHYPIRKGDKIINGQGGIANVNGKRQACYRDYEGNLHTISARCTHMGCELTWNPDEKSFDCPCHGSRFGIDGNMIDNPANVDTK